MNYSVDRVDEELERLLRYALVKGWRKHLNPFLDLLCSRHPHAKAYLVGGAAEERLTALSDVDVLIVLPHPPLHKARFRARPLSEAIERGQPEGFPLDIHVGDEGDLDKYRRMGKVVLLRDCGKP